MAAADPASYLIYLILGIVLSLTCFGIYFSFGPGAKKLLDPWELDDD